MEAGQVWRVAIALLLILKAASASATTFISDTVYWARSGSPVIVTEDMVVQRGGVLQIESGVEVRFAAGTTLVIQGTLEIVGADFVTMTRLDPDQPWQGLKFDRTEQTHIALLDVSGASTGIHVSECYNLALSNVRVTQNSVGLRFDAPSGTRWIRNPVRDSVILGNDYGVYHYASGSALTGNLISRNATGIYGNGPSCGAGSNCGWRIDMYDNLVANNGAGLDLRGFHLVFRNNELRSNRTGLQLQVFNGAYIDADGNNFEFNTDYAVRNSGFLDFDIGSAWFGTRDPAAGLALVYDIYDDLSLGETLFVQADGRFESEAVFDRRFIHGMDAGRWADFELLETGAGGRHIAAGWQLGADAVESLAGFGTDPVVDFGLLDHDAETWAVALIRRAQGWVEVRAKDPQTDLVKGQAQFNPEYSPRVLLLPATASTTLQEPVAVVVGVSLEGRPHAQLKSLVSGAIATRTYFDPAFEFVAATLVPDMDGNGVEEVAVLGRSASGTYRAQVKDPMTGALAGLVFFDPAFTPVDFIGLEESPGNPDPVLAVLGTDDAGRVRVQAKFAGTGDLRQVIYFDRRFHPSMLVAFPTLEGLVLSVFGEDAGGIRRLQSKHLDDGRTIGLVRYSSDFTPMDFTLLGDRDGNGVPEFAMLGYSTSQGSRVQVKDPLTGNVIGNLFRD